MPIDNCLHLSICACIYVSSSFLIFSDSVLFITLLVASWSICVIKLVRNRSSLGTNLISLHHCTVRSAGYNDMHVAKGRGLELWNLVRH